jgi:type IV pilus assembly protein PilB
MKASKLLGESLIEAGLITKEQLQAALIKQRKTGQSLGYTLIKMGFLPQDKLISFLETNLGIPYANLSNYVIDPKVANMLSQDLCERYKVLPLMKVKNVLTIAMVDPLDSFVIDSIRYTTGCEIKPLVSTEKEIAKAIQETFSGKRNLEPKKDKSVLSQLKKVASQGWTTGIDLKKIEESVKQGKESPVIELVNLIISQAVKDKASDIHLEPDDNVFRIRYRVDGMLQEVMTLSKELEPSVVSRIKVIADLDISEKRVPQDGRLKYQFDDREIDVRVSTFPTVVGEKVVLRILDRSSIVIELDKLGFSQDILSKFREAIHRPNGILLLTGPTGSGKSTTLYGALKEINSINFNIVTVEDPVEYRISPINQSQVNVKAGYTFADGLRSILRQDPDIIMIGEIRDYETAEIAIRAALTGHLVFSTLHTNDAAGAFTRLIDMGVEPFLVSSSIIAVMAQRLVRKICPECKEELSPERVVLEKVIDSLPKDREMETIEFYHGKGCKNCKLTGYKGRTCINEIILPNEEIRELISHKATATQIKDASRKAGMRTLREDGMLKVIDGITTIDEVIRVAFMEDN